jgi:predicted Rossmann fold nucleotide-binding protein DprA/Smf involved in DNA uptake
MKTGKTSQLITDKKKEVFYAGDLDIIKKYPVIGVLASGKAPGTVVWDSYHFFYALRDAGVTIAGGWHSPLEKGILDALIEGKVNVAFFAAKGLKGRGFHQKFKLLDKASRGLMISPFPDSVTKINGTERPRLRNELLAAISDVLLIPYIKPGGKLFHMLNAESAFLNKAFVLNHSENDKISLKVRRVDANNVSDLINEAQDAFLKRKS